MNNLNISLTDEDKILMSLKVLYIFWEFWEKWRILLSPWKTSDFRYASTWLMHSDSIRPRGPLTSRGLLDVAKRFIRAETLICWTFNKPKTAVLHRVGYTRKECKYLKKHQCCMDVQPCLLLCMWEPFKFFHEPIGLCGLVHGCNLLKV